MMLSPEDVKCGLFQADRQPSADASDHCGAVAGEALLLFVSRGQ